MFVLPWLPGWSGVFPFLCLQLQTNWCGAWSSCRLGGGGETVQLCVCVREGERQNKISHSEPLQIELASFLPSSCPLLTSYNMQELDGDRPGNEARQNFYNISTFSCKAKSNLTS